VNRLGNLESAHIVALESTGGKINCRGAEEVCNGFGLNPG
jgi:hypothetical protein